MREPPALAAASVLTWPQLVKLLRIPKPGGWASGDLTSWEIGGQVSGSRVFSNVQSTGKFSMLYTGVDSFTDSGAAAQTWTMLAEGAAEPEGVATLTACAKRIAKAQQIKSAPVVAPV